MGMRHRFVHQGAVLGTLLGLITVLIPTVPARAASVETIQSPRTMGQSTMLGNVLNADGTLRPISGMTRSIDATGWAMTTEAGGTPRFVPSTTSPQAVPPGWDPSFGKPGVQGVVTNARVRPRDQCRWFVVCGR